jgi:hypothetical protein
MNNEKRYFETPRSAGEDGWIFDKEKNQPYRTEGPEMTPRYCADCHHQARSINAEPCYTCHEACVDPETWTRPKWEPKVSARKFYDDNAGEIDPQTGGPKE